MKRVLLGTCVAFSVLIISVRNADAVFGFEDTVICENCTQELSEALRHTEVIGKAAQEIARLETQIQQLKTTYNALSHVTDLGSAVGALGMVGIQNPLPVNMEAVEGLVRGARQDSLSGMSVSLNQLVSGSYSANHVYTPPGNSWIAQNTVSRANAIAGSQGMAEELYHSASQRMCYIRQLQARLATAKDPKDVQDLSARLLAELSYAQAQNNQAQALVLWSQQQSASADQQRIEHFMQDADAWVQRAQQPASGD